jgi:hypothetical protein
MSIQKYKMKSLISLYTFRLIDRLQKRFIFPSQIAEFRMIFIVRIGHNINLLFKFNPVLLIYTTNINKEERMKRIAISLIIILILVSVLAGCSPIVPAPTNTPIPTTTPIEKYCDDNEINNFRNQFMPLLQNYYDQVLATVTAPKNLMVDEIDRLREIKINVENLIANPCTVRMQTALINALNSSIEGFLALLSGKSESVQESFFSKGTEFIRQINLELARLAECLPNCKP